MFIYKIVLFTIFAAIVIASEFHYKRSFRSNSLVHCGALEDVNKVFRALMIVTFIFFILIMLGLIKAIIGCCCFQFVAICGLRFLVELPRSLNQYHERSLRDFEVVYDDEGWPVNPNTNRRVRPLEQNTQFCLNVVFFLVIPFAFIHHICKMNYCVESQRPMQHRTRRYRYKMDMYSDEEAENRDMNYVLQQMHRSEQSLRSPRR